MQKREKDSVLVLSVSLILIILFVFLYSFSILTFFEKQASFSVEQNTEKLRNEIDLLFSDAQSRIQLTSNITSNFMTEKELKNKDLFKDAFVNDSIFSAIEYIRWDGINITRSDDVLFDSSDRTYYIEGIKGNSGIWTNFAPKFSKSPLINFYTPLYYNQEIAGVLTGYFDSAEKIRPMLKSSFYGYKTVEILISSDYKVIACSDESLPYGFNFTDYTDKSFVKILMEDAESKIESSFEFESDDKRGFCCIKKLQDKDYYIMQIIPYASLKSAIRAINLKTFVLILHIFAVLIIVIVLAAYKTLKQGKKTETSHLNVIEALSYNYQNVYVGNLKTSAFSIYHISKEIGAKYKEAFASISFDKAMSLYSNNEVYIEDKEIFNTANTTEKLKKIFDKQKVYSFNYRIFRDNEIHFYQASFIKAGQNDEFVAAFKNIDDIIDTEKRLTQLKEKDEAQKNIINSISNIYLTLHLIDLENNTVDVYNTNEEVGKIANRHENASYQMKAVMEDVCTSDDLEMMLSFTDLSTISGRMKNMIYLSKEFISRYRGWCRATFIPVEKDDSGCPVKVIFATQLINDEKRREEKLISIANTDELTNLYNRRAYENELAELEKNPPDENLAYISMDLNGLKKTNDTIGHAAGDELISGAAFCITKAFSSLGNAYRTGGDEFQVIIKASKNEVEQALQNFETIRKNWKGELVKEISISLGAVYSSDNPGLSVSEIAKLADKKMYEAKARFYKENGIDRRS